MNAQPIRKLLCLLLPQRVAGVGDEQTGHPEVAMAICHHCERLPRRRQQALPSHNDAINVKQEAKLGKRASL